MGKYFFAASLTPHDVTRVGRHNPYATPEKGVVTRQYRRRNQRTFNFSEGLYESTVSVESIEKERTGFYTHVPCFTDFARLGPKPCLKMIRSKNSVVHLSDPMNAVFNELMKQWIVVDRYKGVVAISQDVSHILHTYHVPNLKRPSAIVLLNGGNCAGVLDDNGIHALDFKTGQFKMIYRIKNCRGLGMTYVNDFVTFDTDRGQLLIIPQDGSDPVTRDYTFRREINDEYQSSRVSFIGVSERRIWLTDYTLGMITVYRYDPCERTFLEETTVDCNINVAQCRLTGCFVDSKGRALVANCKERILKYIDHNGTVLLDVDTDGEFCRSGGIYVNAAFQALVIDLHSQPPSARLYRVQNGVNTLPTPSKIHGETQVKPKREDNSNFLPTPSKNYGSFLPTPIKNQGSLLPTPSKSQVQTPLKPEPENFRFIHQQRQDKDYRYVAQQLSGMNIDEKP